MITENNLYDYGEQPIPLMKTTYMFHDTRQINCNVASNIKVSQFGTRSLKRYKT